MGVPLPLREGGKLVGEVSALLASMGKCHVVRSLCGPSPYYFGFLLFSYSAFIAASLFIKSLVTCQPPTSQSPALMPEPAMVSKAAEHHELYCAYELWPVLLLPRFDLIHGIGLQSRVDHPAACKE